MHSYQFISMSQGMKSQHSHSILTNFDWRKKIIGVNVAWQLFIQTTPRTKLPVFLVYIAFLFNLQKNISFLTKILSGFSQKSKCLSKSIIFCHHDFNKNRKWHHQCNTDTTKMDHFFEIDIRSCYLVKFWSPSNMCVQILDWVMHFLHIKYAYPLLQTKLPLLKDQSTIHDTDFW